MQKDEIEKRVAQGWQDLYGNGGEPNLVARNGAKILADVIERAGLTIIPKEPDAEEIERVAAAIGTTLPNRAWARAPLSPDQQGEKP